MIETTKKSLTHFIDINEIMIKPHDKLVTEIVDGTIQVRPDQVDVKDEIRKFHRKEIIKSQFGRIIQDDLELEKKIVNFKIKEKTKRKKNAHHLSIMNTDQNSLSASRNGLYDDDKKELLLNRSVQNLYQANIKTEQSTLQA